VPGQDQANIQTTRQRRPGLDQILGQAREQLIEDDPAAAQQRVKVLPLRDSLPPRRIGRQCVPLEHRDPLGKVRQRPRGEQSTDARPQNHRMLHV
jgi:hypothetical protein